MAGLQDSVPRAALLALHARVAGIRPDDWEHPSLAQLWGPRFSAFVVARRDVPVFALGTLPDDERGRRRAVGLADRLEELLDGEVQTYSWAGHTMGVHPASLRYAGATGRVLIRWDGARQPTVWTLPPPDIEPLAARLELARRWLHVSGPSTPAAFARWAGIAPRAGRLVFEALGPGLRPVRTPLGEGWILATDEAAFRKASSAPASPAAVRILPSGDPHLMAGDRELLVPDAANRRELFPPGTVWPGGLMVAGELVGTWRRAAARMTCTRGAACHAASASRWRPRPRRSRCPGSRARSRSPGTADRASGRAELGTNGTCAMPVAGRRLRVRRVSEGTPGTRPFDPCRRHLRRGAAGRSRGRLTPRPAGGR